MARNTRYIKLVMSQPPTLSMSTMAAFNFSHCGPGVTGMHNTSFMQLGDFHLCTKREYNLYHTSFKTKTIIDDILLSPISSWERKSYKEFTASQKFLLSAALSPSRFTCDQILRDSVTVTQIFVDLVNRCP